MPPGRLRHRHLPDVNPSAVTGFMAMLCNQTKITPGSVWRAACSSPPSSANPRLLVASSAIVEPEGLFLVHESTDG